MALPKSKYSDPKHTPGKEFTLNGQDYIGWYVTSYTGKSYTGKYLDNNSKLLLRIKSTAKAEKPQFVQQSVAPSEADIKSGVWKRYFVQKKANKKIIEVTRLKYIEFDRDGSYNRAELDWKIKGPAENQTINGYVYIGADQINRQNTQALESSMPGISSFIKDYSQFVE